MLLWHALFKLSQKVARESRYLVYRTLTKHLGHKNLIPDLYTLGCTAVALAENHGIPLTPAETIHQIVRSFLHLHDPPLQAIIWAYLRRYYSLITDREAFAVLVFALETELKQFFKESEPWDMAFIDNFFKTKDNHRLRVLMVLNYGLITLENRVVFIEWIGDWKNFMKLGMASLGEVWESSDECLCVWCVRRQCRERAQPLCVFNTVMISMRIRVLTGRSLHDPWARVLV